MPIKNYTTSVPEEKTVGEIQMLLSMKGARSIQIDYDERGRPSAVSFMIIIENIPIPFRLPCNFEGVFKAITRAYTQKYVRQRWENDPGSMAQARRVAWRIVKDWVAAQMALIEAEQATLVQVFLPYAVVHDKQASLSMYDKFMLQVINQKALTENVDVGV